MIAWPSWSIGVCPKCPSLLTRVLNTAQMGEPALKFPSPPPPPKKRKIKWRCTLVCLYVTSPCNDCKYKCWRIDTYVSRHLSIYLASYLSNLVYFHLIYSYFIYCYLIFSHLIYSYLSIHTSILLVCWCCLMPLIVGIKIFFEGWCSTFSPCHKCP